MEVTYMLIVGVIAYVFGAITKVFIAEIPNKFIPLQNVLIGIISGFVCYFVGVEPNLFYSLLLCIASTLSAGGVADLVKLIRNK